MTPSSVAIKPKTYSLKSIACALVITMTATAVYMLVIIRNVPKTVSNSKAGIFAELVDQLLEINEKGAGLLPTADYAVVNAALKQKFRESPWSLRASKTWQLDAWADSSIHDRPLLLAHYHDAENHKLLLGIIPISKRNFPRSGGFSHKDAWFMTFGKDYTKTQADAAFPEKQVASHLDEVMKLEARGLNLVATNYGNDFFILMLSSVDSKDLGAQLFEMSSIFETAP